MAALASGLSVRVRDAIVRWNGGQRKEEGNERQLMVCVFDGTLWPVVWRTKLGRRCKIDRASQEKEGR
jgi:hypothetical protein